MLTGRPPFEGDAALSIRDPTPATRSRLGWRTYGGPAQRSVPYRPQDARQSPAGPAPDRRPVADGTPRLGARGPGRRLAERDWKIGPQPELQTLTAARAEATQQLAAVLQREASWRRRPHLFWRLAGLVFLAFLSGSVLAWATRPAPLLQVSEAELPRSTAAHGARPVSVRRQHGTQRAWESVERYFPAEQNEQNRY